MCMLLTKYIIITLLVDVVVTPTWFDGYVHSIFICYVSFS